MEEPDAKARIASNQEEHLADNNAEYHGVARLRVEELRKRRYELDGALRSAHGRCDLAGCTFRHPGQEWVHRRRVPEAGADPVSQHPQTASRFSWWLRDPLRE